MSLRDNKGRCANTGFGVMKPEKVDRRNTIVKNIPRRDPKARRKLAQRGQIAQREQTSAPDSSNSGANMSMAIVKQNKADPRDCEIEKHPGRVAAPKDHVLERDRLTQQRKSEQGKVLQKLPVTDLFSSYLRRAAEIQQTRVSLKIEAPMVLAPAPPPSQDSAVLREWKDWLKNDTQTFKDEIAKLRNETKANDDTKIKGQKDQEGGMTTRVEDEDALTVDKTNALTSVTGHGLVLDFFRAGTFNALICAQAKTRQQTQIEATIAQREVAESWLAQEQERVIDIRKSKDEVLRYQWSSSNPPKRIVIRRLSPEWNFPGASRSIFNRVQYSDGAESFVKIQVAGNGSEAGSREPLPMNRKRNNSGGAHGDDDRQRKRQLVDIEVVTYSASEKAKAQLAIVLLREKLVSVVGLGERKTPPRKLKAAMRLRRWLKRQAEEIEVEQTDAITFTIEFGDEKVPMGYRYCEAREGTHSARSCLCSRRQVHYEQFPSHYRACGICGRLHSGISCIAQYPEGVVDGAPNSSRFYGRQAGIHLPAELGGMPAPVLSGRSDDPAWMAAKSVRDDIGLRFNIRVEERDDIGDDEAHGALMRGEHPEYVVRRVAKLPPLAQAATGFGAPSRTAASTSFGHFEQASSNSASGSEHSTPQSGRSSTKSSVDNQSGISSARGHVPSIAPLNAPTGPRNRNGGGYYNASTSRNGKLDDVGRVNTAETGAPETKMVHVKSLSGDIDVDERFDEILDQSPQEPLRSNRPTQDVEMGDYLPATVTSRDNRAGSRRVHEDRDGDLSMDEVFRAPLGPRNTNFANRIPPRPREPQTASRTPPDEHEDERAVNEGHRQEAHDR